MKATVCRTIWTAIPAIAVALVLAGFGRADDKPKPKEPTKKLSVMQQKLVDAQKVLEALATKDFKKLEKAADGLIEGVNHETWKINETAQYVVYTNDFLRPAKGLKRAAQDKNIDAAALAYVDMTLTCVKCHQFLRGDDIRAEVEVPTLAGK